MTFALEVPRGRQNPLRPLTKGLKAADPADAEAIRANHAATNGKQVLLAIGSVSSGRAAARLQPAKDEKALDDPVFGGTFVLKAWIEAAPRVLLGAREVAVPPAPGK